MIDFYLDDERAKERGEILHLVAKTDPASVELLHGYVREGMRESSLKLGNYFRNLPMSPTRSQSSGNFCISAIMLKTAVSLSSQFAGLWRSAAVDADIVQGDGQPNVSIQAGDRIWASFTNAHLNVSLVSIICRGAASPDVYSQPAEFPEPYTIDPTRPKRLYNLQGYGFHACPGYEMSLVTIVEMVRVVFSLKNIRRAPGDAGRLQKITTIKNETPTYQYVQPNGELSMWPGPMQIVVRFFHGVEFTS